MQRLLSHDVESASGASLKTPLNKAWRLHDFIIMDKLFQGGSGAVFKAKSKLDHKVKGCHLPPCCALASADCFHLAVSGVRVEAALGCRIG